MAGADAGGRGALGRGDGSLCGGGADRAVVLGPAARAVGILRGWGGGGESDKHAYTSSRSLGEREEEEGRGRGREDLFCVSVAG